LISNFALSLNLSSSSIWLALAIILIIVEIMHPLGFFASFSIASLLICAKAYFYSDFNSEWLFLDEALFCIVGVLLILPVRRIINKYLDNTPNINDI